MKDNKYIQSLISNAQSGNNAAFEQLYRMTAEKVFTICFRLTGNLSSAKSITINAFIAAWENISKLDYTISFSEWMKIKAAETFLNYRKEEKVKTEGDQILHLNTFEKDILKLSLVSRIVFLMHDIEKLNLLTISKLIGVSEKEAENLLLAARKNLVEFGEE